MNAKEKMFVKQYEVYEVDLSSEALGIVPCVVVQNNTGNLYGPNTIVVPLLKEKVDDTGLYFCAEFEKIGKRYFAAHYLMTVSKRRIVCDGPMFVIKDYEIKEKVQQYYFAISGYKRVICDGQYELVDLEQEEIDALYKLSREI